MKSQIIVVAYHNANGDVISSTEIRNQGVLDAVFASEDTGNAMGEELGYELLYYRRQRSYL
ncbi:hypothetical protein OH492_11510 [Vibrio chagasii]|nr:hypothetical protein [Vibrio chagasii]